MRQDIWGMSAREYFDADEDMRALLRLTCDAKIERLTRDGDA